MEEKVELTELQDYVYGIFREFDRICRKHNLKYTLEGGSLLGAVKYQGFVPWDDDIDIVMKREEYDKLLKIAPQELHSDYFLQTYNNVREFPLNYAKLCYNKSTIYDYDYTHLKTMNHGIFIDIFPVDNVIPSKMKKQLHLIGLLTGARKTKLKINFGKTRFIKRVLYKIVSLLPMKTLCNMLNRACTKYNGKETGYCYEVCNSNSKFAPLPSHIYDNLTELKFRDSMYMAVSEYDTFLKSRFGENYMDELPPEEARKPSHNQNIIIYKDTENE